jgi:hypothetical protein
MGLYAMLAFNASAVDPGQPQEITEPSLPV